MFSGYTIGEYKILDPRADDYLLALGRAVHIAAAFERKSRELVVRLRSVEDMGPMFHIVNSLDELLDTSKTEAPSEELFSAEKWELQEVAARAKTEKQPLAHVLGRLQDEVQNDPYGVEKLTEARKARNWIAHNAGLVFLPDHRSWSSGHFLRSFRNAVLIVAHADALISELTWIEPDNWHSVGPPEEYSDVYPELVVTWVFEKVWDLIPTDDLPPWRPHPGGPHRRLRERLEEGS